MIPDVRIIYHQPHESRKQEAAFRRAFNFPEVRSIDENYPIDPNSLDLLVDTDRLIHSLQRDTKLPAAKRQRCIEILGDCPSQIKVALEPRRISFDLVVVADNVPYYWEFHEEQHRRLTIERPKNIYSPDGAPIEVPRFLQRLVRDVWRTQYFRPYTIVWSDWFAGHSQPDPVRLEPGFREFHLPGAFSFRGLLEEGDAIGQ